MTDLFRTDFSAGLPLQISKHIARLVSGNLLAVGGTADEVRDLIVLNLLAANGSYLVWDYNGKISEATAGRMKAKGYQVYEVDPLNKKYCSCVELLVCKPKMFFEDKVVIYLKHSCPCSTPRFVDMLLRGKYLHGQHLTLIANGFDPDYSYMWDKGYDESQLSAFVHIDSLADADETIINSCDYKLFLDNSDDSSISYLNKIIPVFASFKDINLADYRDVKTSHGSAAVDVKILEGFRDMDKDDCLFVENGKTFIFDKKKTWKPEIEEGLKPDHTGQLLAALLAGTAAGILLFMTKRKR